MALWRRGVGFAPVSASIAAAAWLSALILSPLLAPSETGDVPVSEPKRTARFASRALVTGLYQNVLFFVAPIWLASATVFSMNIVFPLILALLALLSCFDAFFAAQVLSHTMRRNAVSAVVLFAVSVPALCVLTHLPIRISIAACAFVSTLAASVLGRPVRHLGRHTVMGTWIAATTAAALYFGAPLLPPTPVQCMQAVAAPRIERKDPQDTTNHFTKGAAKVFAHFSVAAPERFSQDISFQWYVNGDKRGKPIPSKIVGGRKHGFRTWTYLSSPAGGRYRVDLLTADNQLIGQVTFRVR